MSKFIDHYARIGVSSRADRGEIEAAYVKSIEVNPSLPLDEPTLKRLEDLKQSRDILANPVTRHIYDINHRNYHFIAAIRAIRSGLDNAVRDAEQIVASTKRV